MKNLAFGKVGSCFVLICSSKPPTDEDWDGYLRFLREHLTPTMQPRTLVWSEGGAPSANQRQRLNAITGPFSKTSKIAVMTTSPIVRGVVGALSWFNSHYRAFPPNDLELAIGFLDVTGSPALELKQLIRNLKASVAA